jgi:uncharacterized short protein YbdD (DUF466 family)
MKHKGPAKDYVTAEWFLVETEDDRKIMKHKGPAKDYVTAEWFQEILEDRTKTSESEFPNRLETTPSSEEGHAPETESLTE